MRSLAQFTEKHIKILTLEVTANLIEDTPRDTGWARSNWIPSIGQSTETIAGSPDNITPAAQQRGLAEVASTYKLSRGAVFVTNNVPYILPLNDGHSKQAPAGFVQLSILRAVRSTFGRAA